MEREFLAAAKKELRKKGYKLTGPRLAIISYLARDKGHPAVQQIYDNIRSEYPGIGVATVYRTVDLLLELGIVRAVTIKNNCPRYEANWPGDHHHHLVCKSCGRITEFGSCNFQLITEEIEKVTRYKIEEHSLEAYGLCSQCLSGSSPYSTDNI